MAVAPDVPTTLLDGSSPRLGSPASSRPPEFLPHGVQRLPAPLCPAGRLGPDVPEGSAHGSLRSAPGWLPQVAPGPVEVTGDSRAPADGVRVDVRRPGVRTVHA